MRGVALRKIYAKEQKQHWLYNVHLQLGARCPTLETRGNFEPLRTQIWPPPTLPFFPLKSALSTLSGGFCGEIWTRNVSNLTLVAQTGPC